MLSQNNGNEYNTNIWWYRRIILWILDIFGEYGIEVEPVKEDYTSKECSIYGNKHKNGRIIEGCMNAKIGGRSIQTSMQR